MGQTTRTTNRKTTNTTANRNTNKHDNSTVRMDNQQHTNGNNIHNNNNNKHNSVEEQNKMEKPKSERTEREKRLDEKNRINTLITKQKKLLKTYYNKTRFQEPALILLRNSQQAEFYEGITTGKYKYTHSDGRERELLVTNSRRYQFPYLNESFSCYIAHEDSTTVLPEDPILTSELYMISKNKDLNDIQNYKAKELKAVSGLVKTIGLILIGLIIAYAIYKMILPPQATNTAAETIKNITPKIPSTTPTIL